MTDAGDHAIDVLAALVGAKVRRVDVPEDDLLALTLHGVGPGERVMLLSLAPHAPGIGLVPERPRGEPAGSFAQLLRKRIAGASLSRIEAIAPSTLAILTRRTDARTRLVAHLGRRPGLAVLDELGRCLATLPSGADVPAARARTADGRADEWPRDVDELVVAGAGLLARRARGGQAGRARELEKALRRAQTKVERRARAIEHDLAATAEAPRLRADAGLLLASLRAVPAHAAEVTLVDPETGEHRRLVLDPSLAASAQAERWFVRARKLDRGARIASERLALAQGELAAIDAARAALEQGDASAAEAWSAAPAPASPRPGHAISRAVRRAPYRTFVLEDGSVVLVGRSARDNDALTFRVAAPNDHFFHARAATGAHVILRDVPGRAPTADAVRAAAVLAAHFSVARGQTAADVTQARRSDLRRGKAAGQVLTRTSSTLRARWTDDELRALLTREQV